MIKKEIGEMEERVHEEKEEEKKRKKSGESVTVEMRNRQIERKKDIEYYGKITHDDATRYVMNVKITRLLNESHRVYAKEVMFALEELQSVAYSLKAVLQTKGNQLQALKATVDQFEKYMPLQDLSSTVVGLLDVEPCPFSLQNTQRSNLKERAEQTVSTGVDLTPTDVYVQDQTRAMVRTIVKSIESEFTMATPLKQLTAICTAMTRLKNKLESMGHGEMSKIFELSPRIDETLKLWVEKYKKENVSSEASVKGTEAESALPPQSTFAEALRLISNISDI